MSDNGEIWIPMSKSHCDEALKEWCARYPYMQQKFKNANPFNRLRSGLFGLIIEKHVLHFLQDKFPSAIQLPDNHEDYTAICNHDMKMELGDKTYLIDVYGQRFSDYRDGKPYYDLSIGGKPDCSIYLFARIVDDGWTPNPRVLFEGWTSRERLQEYKREYSEYSTTVKVHLPCRKYVWPAEKFLSIVSERLIK